MENIDLYKLIYSKPINNYVWLFCDNDKVKECLLKAKENEISFINEKIKEQSDIEMDVLDYGYSHIYRYSENRENINKYIIVKIKKYNIILALMNYTGWNNTLNNKFFINDDYLHYYYDCNNNEYYETKNIKYDDLINLNIKLDYNNAYDKFIELI
jgi:hypothetical protein